MFALTQISMTKQENPLDMPYAASQFSARTKSIPTPSSTADTSGDLARVFNTAMVATRASETPDFFAELFSLVETPEFRAILGAVRELSNQAGISEREAAERVIRTFRKMDQIWGSYLCQEGKDRVLKC